MPQKTIPLTVIGLYISKVRGEISIPVPEVRFIPEHGIMGNTVFGKTRIRSTGEVVPNIRHFTAVTPHELGTIADALGVPYIDPAWVKANICFTCPNDIQFTEVLVEGTEFVNVEGRTVLKVMGETVPCLKAGKTVVSQFPHLKAMAQQFPKVAYKRRGIHGITLEEFTLTINETLTAIIP